MVNNLKDNTMKIYNNVEDLVLFESIYSKEDYLKSLEDDKGKGLILFTTKIANENDDFDGNIANFSLETTADCIDYIETYCDNLDIIDHII